MTRYIARRLLLVIPNLFIISVVVFLFIHMIPGDPATTLAGQNATPERLEELRTRLGLDQPLHIQYAKWLTQALQGDFGRSIRSRKPVLDEITDRLPATVELAVTGLALAVAAGIPLGILAATRHNSIFDRVSMVLTVGGRSMPVYWLGLLLIYFFSYVFEVLPFSGRIDFGVDLGPGTGFYLLDSILQTNGAAFRNVLAHLTLPAATLAVVQIALVGRLTRSSMLEVLSQDYVRTARSKGLAERVVVYRHALRNAAIPLVTVVGLQLGSLLGGSILTESVFAWPGVGRMTVEAVFGRDYPLIQGCVLIFALGFVLTNVVVDLLYGMLDPRISYA
jgi:peptide/nickel transport system permease protein